MGCSNSSEGGDVGHQDDMMSDVTTRRGHRRRATSRRPNRTGTATDTGSNDPFSDDDDTTRFIIGDGTTTRSPTAGEPTPEDVAAMFTPRLLSPRDTACPMSTRQRRRRRAPNSRRGGTAQSANGTTTIRLGYDGTTTGDAEEDDDEDLTDDEYQAIERESAANRKIILQRLPRFTFSLPHLVDDGVTTSNKPKEDSQDSVATAPKSVSPRVLPRLPLGSPPSPSRLQLSPEQLQQPASPTFSQEGEEEQVDTPSDASHYPNVLVAASAHSPNEIATVHPKETFNEDEHVCSPVKSPTTKEEEECAHGATSPITRDYLKTECSVCFEPNAGTSRELIMLPCFHVFHEECVREWLETVGCCPTCRTMLSPAALTWDMDVEDEEQA